jgi:hypothetical protein
MKGTRAMWSVRVDADTGLDFDEELGAHLRWRLADRQPAAGAGHVAGRLVAGRVSVQLSVNESSARKAVDVAAREVAAALREHGLQPHIVRLDVMPEEELDEELDKTPPELMGVREIAAAVDPDNPISRQRADQLTKRDDFPQPIAELASGKVWSGAAVRRWLATWERKSGRPKASAG